MLEQQHLVNLLVKLAVSAALDKELLWKFTPFPDLSLYRLALLRKRDLQISVFSITCIGVILLAELLRSALSVPFGQYGVFALYHDWGEMTPLMWVEVYATT